ncbi:lipoprotein N-acyltransferase Lnb domain-containing protein [Pontimicrobium aquaticum]|uniref:DUF4105 domain-containing protein n=1 Tax=Pontimicrobium aquaticum TaxID=2565367 RepID=A0A4U0EPA2_9FLAO|nr:DUF4105 domain-containing protein [Pontimicrobium aquaticum]TJY32914.1 DUF4105 domain-containing protein [Pontimicrobium aquaticum]
MRIKLLLLFLLCSTVANAQLKLSDQAEISVLTVGPGTLLMDAFGHNGFRVRDKGRQIDEVFNYGTFDFDTPNFYLKFAQGKLNYKLSHNSYDNFFQFYISQNRSIDEQILDLTQAQKQQVFNFLLNNAKPENIYYLYDFFYDNCATKMKDVLKMSLDESIIFNQPDNFNPKTFRALIHEHVNKNSWGSLGIDVALGSVIDKTATPEEHMFLPKYIYAFFEKATFANSNKPLVKQSRSLYEKRDRPISSLFLMSPLMIFGLLGMLIIWLTYKDYKKGVRNKKLDIGLFSVTGLIGVFLLLLWFATDHTATANNYNLLWAVPLNLLAIRQVLKKTPNDWFKKYLKFLVILFCLLTLHWIIGVQVFAIGLIPLFIALIIRYVFLLKFYN